MEENSTNVQKNDSKKKDSTVIIIVACIAILMHSLGFTFDIRFWFLGRFLGLIDLLLLLNLKKGIFRKKVLIEIVTVIGLCLVFFFFGENISQALTPKYELTEEEKAWLKKYYSDDAEQIEKGRLGGSQKNILEEGRLGKEYLKEKYPEYEFEIRYYSDWSFPLKEFGVREINSDYEFIMYITKNEDKTYKIEDNFYVYLIEDEYQTYLEEQIKARVKDVAVVEVFLSGVHGKEYNSSMSVEDIVSGKLEIYPHVNIHIPAKGMTEEECKTYAEIVKTEIEMINLDGSYHIKFWDVTEKEMVIDDIYTNRIYYEIINI